MASLSLLLVEKENNRKKVVQMPSDMTVTALTELAAKSFDLLPGSTVIECYDADLGHAKASSHIYPLIITACSI